MSAGTEDHGALCYAHWKPQHARKRLQYSTSDWIKNTTRYVRKYANATAIQLFTGVAAAAVVQLICLR